MKGKVCLTIVSLLLLSYAFVPPSKCDDVQEEIFLYTEFLDSTQIRLEINTINFDTSVIIILDSENNTIFNGNQSQEIMINVERGKPYYLIAQNSTGNNLTNVFYCTENVLESMPIDFWLGEEYQDYYNEYLDVFEQAYNILINLTRNGEEIQTGGVTINRVNKAVAYGAWGSFTYGIQHWFEDPFITQKVYLPGNTATYIHPEAGPLQMSARLALSTRFHELAHAVLLETCGDDPFPQEGIACFFEIELFRLLGYTQEYINEAAPLTINHFQNNYIGENFSTTGPQFMLAYNHTYPGAWIAAYVLEDLVGYGEFEDQIMIAPANYLPDFGWDFLKDYFNYSTIYAAPLEYNINERLLYFFELASNASLKQNFIDWGFNITSAYDEYFPPNPVIIPEFSSINILATFVFTTLFVIIVARKRK